MLNYIGYDSEMISSPEDIIKYDVVILPGVGSYDTAMEILNKSNWPLHIKNFLDLDRTLIGICLGMQLLSTSSEEGSLNGLNLIPGIVKKIPNEFISPHMGWNKVTFNDDSFESINKFYFVHSYHYIPQDKNNILGVTSYNFDFVSAVRKDNIYDFQFHPEKSHKHGMNLLRNVIEKSYAK